MTSLKICGMRSEADLDACAEADYHGFILSSASPRCLSVEEAQRLMSQSKAKRVLVTTETDMAKVEALSRELRPDVLQLHSPMTVSEVQRARSLAPEVWALISMDGGNERTRLEGLRGHCDGVVLDTACARAGGSGLTHDWNASATAKDHFHGKVILAGGLKASNVAEAVRTVRPHIIDVASGVERGRGKDRRLFEELKIALRRVDDEQR